MKIETLKAISYSRGTHTLRVLVQAENTLQVTNTLVGKERLRVIADNQEKEQLVEVLQGYQFLSSIKQLSERDFEVILATQQPSIEQIKGERIKEVQTFDTSEQVNLFFLAGAPLWLSKEMRVGLMNSINIEKAEGRTETSLWFAGKQFRFPVNDALDMLYELELYALECYNVTQAHIAAVKTLTTKEEIEGYDYETGYPQKLRFAESTNENGQEV